MEHLKLGIVDDMIYQGLENITIYLSIMSFSLNNSTKFDCPVVFNTYSA